MNRGRRLALRILYTLAVPCGEAAAYLVRLYWNLRSSDRAPLPMASLATAFVLGAWVPMRLLFLVFAGGCQAVAPKAPSARGKRARTTAGRSVRRTPTATS